MENMAREKIFILLARQAALTARDNERARNQSEPYHWETLPDDIADDISLSDGLANACWFAAARLRRDVVAHALRSYAKAYACEDEHGVFLRVATNKEIGMFYALKNASDCL